jgi:HPr kinase/phosphorylase
VESQVHGALVEVLGVGVLIRGPSGIGKSEIALELVARGHRLVADDVVRIRRLEDGGLSGYAPEIIRHHLEIRGIGILYIPDLYGAEAVCESARIGVVCRLEHWREDQEYDRVGFARATELVAGAAVPVILLPVRPSGSMATLIEVAIRDHLRRCAGAGSAASRLDKRLRSLAEHP